MSFGAAINSLNNTVPLAGGTPSVKSGASKPQVISESRSSQLQTSSLPSFLTLFAHVLPAASDPESVPPAGAAEISHSPLVNTPSQNHSAASQGTENASSSARNADAEALIRTPFGYCPTLTTKANRSLQSKQGVQSGGLFGLACVSVDQADAQKQIRNSGLFGLADAGIFAPTGASAAIAASPSKVEFRRG